MSIVVVIYAYENMGRLLQILQRPYHVERHVQVLFYYEKLSLV